jgi:hypothetical protein
MFPGPQNWLQLVTKKERKTETDSSRSDDKDGGKGAGGDRSKCSLAKCLRLKKVKKIEAIISSSRLSAFSAELRGDGILAFPSTTRVQYDDHFDRRVSARKNKHEALRGWVKIELLWRISGFREQPDDPSARATWFERERW